LSILNTFFRSSIVWAGSWHKWGVVSFKIPGSTSLKNRYKVLLALALPATNPESWFNELQRTTKLKDEVLSRNLRRLLSKGMITKEAQGKGRKTSYSITSKGHSYLRDLFMEYHPNLRNYLNSLARMVSTLLLWDRHPTYRDGLLRVPAKRDAEPAVVFKDLRDYENNLKEKVPHLKKHALARRILTGRDFNMTSYLRGAIEGALEGKENLSKADRIDLWHLWHKIECTSSMLSQEVRGLKRTSSGGYIIRTIDGREHEVKLRPLTAGWFQGFHEKLRKAHVLDSKDPRAG